MAVCHLTDHVTPSYVSAKPKHLRNQAIAFHKYTERSVIVLE